MQYLLEILSSFSNKIYKLLLTLFIIKLYARINTEYDKLVSKVDNTDTTNFVLKTKYKNDGSDLEKKISGVDKKIPDVSDLVKKQILMLNLLK